MSESQRQRDERKRRLARDRKQREEAEREYERKQATQTFGRRVLEQQLIGASEARKAQHRKDIGMTAGGQSMTGYAGTARPKDMPKEWFDPVVASVRPQDVRHYRYTEAMSRLNTSKKRRSTGPSASTPKPSARTPSSTPKKGSPAPKKSNSRRFATTDEMFRRSTARSPEQFSAAQILHSPDAARAAMSHSSRIKTKIDQEASAAYYPSISQRSSVEYLDQLRAKEEKSKGKSKYIPNAQKQRDEDEYSSEHYSEGSEFEALKTPMKKVRVEAPPQSSTRKEREVMGNLQLNLQLESPTPKARSSRGLGASQRQGGGSSATRDEAPAPRKFSWTDMAAAWAKEKRRK